METNNVNKCVVCNNPSNGVHYNAVTCEPCKVFFKRTVQAKKVYTCKSKPKKGCPMTVRGRASCSFCRFYQCLNNGMKIEMVRENRKRGNTFKLLKDKIRQDKSIIDIDFILDKWRRESEQLSMDTQTNSTATSEQNLEINEQRETRLTHANIPEYFHNNKSAVVEENYTEYPESFNSSENYPTSNEDCLQTKLDLSLYNKNPEYTWDRDFFQLELNPFANFTQKNYDSRLKEIYGHLYVTWHENYLKIISTRLLLMRIFQNPDVVPQSGV